MLMTRAKLEEFSKRPVADPRKETGAFLAITADSCAEVDALVEKALSAGASRLAEPQDHGFMYSRSFFDLDGHHWEVFWMDPASIEG